MECQGKVTALNHLLLSFTLDNKTNIQMGLLLAQREDLGLPKFGSQVILKKCHSFPQRRQVFLCNCCQFWGSFTVPRIPNNRLYSLIKNHNLGVRDLLEITQNISVLKQNFLSLTVKAQCDLMLDIVENLINLRKVPPIIDKNPCLNQIVPKLILKSVNDCQFIDLNSDRCKDNFWSFGVHRTPLKHQFLIGYFTVDPTYGLLTLQDKNYRIFTLITNCKSIEDLIDKQVLIRDYIVITETYPEKGLRNLEYLLLDYQNITVLSKNQNKINVGKYSKSLKFRIISISSVQLGLLSNKPEIWLQGESSFLCLPQSYVKLALVLKKGGLYTIQHNKPLKTVKNWEICRIYPSYQQFELDEPNANFVCDQFYDHLKLQSVGACKRGFLDTKGLVSFKGRLSSKYLNDPLDSRTQRLPIGGFGTPGKQTQKLEFQDKNGEIVRLYLNNFERLLTPLGLIPDMIMAVHNVVIQSSSYLKCTALTRLEVICYNPPVKFCSANLKFEGDIQPWGNSYYLGRGVNIPRNVTIWGKALKLQVNSVKMTYNCQKCGYVVESDDNCDNCRHPEKILDVYIQVFAKDKYGEFKIVSKQANFLMLLLNFTEKQFEVFMKTFEGVGNFEFNRFEENLYQDRHPGRRKFKESLRDFLVVFSKSRRLTQYEFKCKKFKNENTKRKKLGRAVWLCLEHRKL